MNSNIFSGTKGFKDARVLIVGEAYGRQEASRGVPFVGDSGQDLDNLLAEANIPANWCFFTNVINERPRDNDMTEFFYSNAEAKALKLTPTKGLYPKPNVVAGIAKLKAVIDAINPEIIIGFGNYALWALTDQSFDIKSDRGTKIPGGITKWRGSQLRTSDFFGRRRFLPTYHPAAALRTYPWRRMIQHDLATRVHQALAGEWDEPQPDFILRPSFQKTTQFIHEILRNLSEGPTRVTLDLETGGEHISCCGLTIKADQAICIPFHTITGRYWSVEEEAIIIELMHDVLLHPNCLLEGQNLLYDTQYIYQDWFILPRIHFDTMIAHHTCWPGGGDPTSQKAAVQGVQMKALYNIASLYCRFYYYWKDEGKNFGYIDEMQGWAYNCRDCIKTYESATELQRLVVEFDLAEQFAFQMRVANDMLLPMMLRGVKRDNDAVEMVRFELGCANFDIEEFLEGIIPKDLEPKNKTGKGSPWYDSPKKLATLFYDVLGMKPILSDAGTPTTSKQALPTLGQREPIIKPIAEKIEIKRSLGVFESTFCGMESDEDGRLRCSYKLTGTDTFRLASSENAFGRGGNLQNIPGGKETEIELDFEFPNIRKQFLPDDGYEIAEFDLSGADAQTVAWEAEDEDLKDAFRKGLKLHLKNARDVYPEKTKDMTDEEITALKHDGGLYSNVKKLAHGTNFGGSAPGLAERVRIPLKEAQEFQERWFYVHPGIKNWHIQTNQKLVGMRCWRCDTVHEQPRNSCPECGAFPQKNTIGNKFGYRIVYFERPRDLFNAALAWTPQSTTAINCNKGAIALVDHCPWVQLLMQVHDSLIVQYPIDCHDLLPEVGRALHSIKVPYKDPLLIPWGCEISRASWGGVEKYKWTENYQ